MKNHHVITIASILSAITPSIYAANNNICAYVFPNRNSNYDSNADSTLTNHANETLCQDSSDGPHVTSSPKFQVPVGLRWSAVRWMVTRIINLMKRGKGYLRIFKRWRSYRSIFRGFWGGLGLKERGIEVFFFLEIWNIIENHQMVLIGFVHVLANVLEM